MVKRISKWSFQANWTDNNGRFLKSLYDNGAFRGSPFNSEYERKDALKKYEHLKSTLSRKFPYNVDNGTIGGVIFIIIAYFTHKGIAYDGEIVNIIFNLVRLFFLGGIGFFLYKFLVNQRDKSFDKTVSELSDYTYWEMTIPVDDEDVIRIINNYEKEIGIKD